MNKKMRINPVTLLFLGVVPAIAASTNVLDALGMSLAALCVLLCSTLVLGLLRKVLDEGTFFAAALLTVAAFAAMAQLLLRAFLPSLTEMLGYYTAILAAELLFFGREEKLGKALGSALLNGLCFAICVLLLAALRELFGAASIAGTPVELLKPYKIPALCEVSGGLILFAILLALVQAIFPARKRDAAPAEAEKEA